MRYALIDGTTVVNVILWDGAAPYDAGDLALVQCPDGIGVGWTYQDGAWIAPPPSE